jgi:hypothetical protein
VKQEQEIALLRPLQPKLLEHLDTIVSSAGTWWSEVSGKGRKVIELVDMLQRCYNTRSSLMSAASAEEEGFSASEPQPYQLLQDLAKANKGTLNPTIFFVPPVLINCNSIILQKYCASYYRRHCSRLPLPSAALSDPIQVTQMQLADANLQNFKPR